MFRLLCIAAFLLVTVRAATWKGADDEADDVADVADDVGDDVEPQDLEKSDCIGCGSQAYQDGYYYYFYDRKLPWQESVDFCRRLGYSLLEITNYRQNAFIVNEIRKRYGATIDHSWTWLNINDRHAEGRWVRGSNHAALSFTAWGAGQPDNKRHGWDDEDCAVVTLEGWNDVCCEHLRARLVCQQPILIEN